MPQRKGIQYSLTKPAAAPGAAAGGSPSSSAHSSPHSSPQLASAGGSGGLALDDGGADTPVRLVLDAGADWQTVITPRTSDDHRGARPDPEPEPQPAAECNACQHCPDVCASASHFPPGSLLLAVASRC